jgi:hypothetical protein
LQIGFALMNYGKEKVVGKPEKNPGGQQTGQVERMEYPRHYRPLRWNRLEATGSTMLKLKLIGD